MPLEREPLTLGIETSCDDTAAAILRGRREVAASLISSQIDSHAAFGGVMPELASRMHMEAIIPLVRAVMSDAGATPAEIDLIAVTAGPGLLGSLLVGVMTAKGLAQGWGVPIIAVNHLEGHIYANILAHERLEPPFLCLIVSGGHTEVVLARGEGRYALLGATRDDAAGEAYDKAAKMLGLGYPGGPIMERLAEGGDDRAFKFPVALKGSREAEFSFSGLKTAFRTEVERLGGEIGSPSCAEAVPVADLAASYQRAVTAQLVERTMLAARQTGVKRLTISGGVAANTRLREELSARCHRDGVELFLPPKLYCTDNAAMIAAAGRARFERDGPSGLNFQADPSWEIWEA